jgi:hypothetical protein
MTADQAAIVEVEGNLVSRLTDDEYANFIASQEEEATEDRRDWKTAARRFFGLSSSKTDA